MCWESGPGAGPSPMIRRPAGGGRIASPHLQPQQSPAGPFTDVLKRLDYHQSRTAKGSSWDYAVLLQRKKQRGRVSSSLFICLLAPARIL